MNCIIRLDGQAWVAVTPAMVSEACCKLAGARCAKRSASWSAKASWSFIPPRPSSPGGLPRWRKRSTHRGPFWNGSPSRKRPSASPLKRSRNFRPLWTRWTKVPGLTMSERSSGSTSGFTNNCIHSPGMRCRRVFCPSYGGESTALWR